VELIHDPEPIFDKLFFSDNLCCREKSIQNEANRVCFPNLCCKNADRRRSVQDNGCEKPVNSALLKLKF
jgi:hypothetical protein